MARRVFLHVGLPKTGTTFIQTTMWHNRDLLRRQGFLYPGTNRMDHYRASQEVRGTPARRMGPHAGIWQRLLGELARWDGDGLISHEFFSMATPEQAQAAVDQLAPAEVVAIVTVRSYVLQFPAVWQEALKMNSELSFDEFMAQALAGDVRGAWSWDSQDIPAVLARWSEALPATQIKVVTVPPAGQSPGALWDRWVEAIGIDDTGFDSDVAFTNTSIGAAQAALLHRVKPYLTGPLTKGNERHRWVRQYFGHEVLVPQRGARFGPRAHHAALLTERAETAVSAIKDGGYPVIGDLSELVSPEPPAGPHPDDIGDGEIADVAARAIEQMIRDVRRLEKQRDRWRARARRRPRTRTVRLLHRVTAKMKRSAT